MQTNVNPVLTPAQVTAAIGGVTTITNNLPGMINLTEDEKLHASKMGPDTYDYVARALLLMAQNPTLIPNWSPAVAVTQTNMDTFNSLRNVKMAIEVLMPKIDDTMTQMGIQLKKASDDFYGNAQAADQRGSVPGADGVVNALKDFYEKSKAEQTAPVQ